MVDRRGFLHGSLAGLGGLLWGVRARGAPLANQLTVGLIGCGGMGNAHIGQIAGHGNQFRLVAVCDVDAERLAAAAGRLPGLAAYGSYQELLAHPDLDVVCIATPDHWHALCTVRAVEAGKHVYVEKPLSHSVAEGRAMVTAARRHQRVVQLGTMQRSWPLFRHVVELVRNRAFGAVEHVRCWFGGGPAFAPQAFGEPPVTLDWDQWQGPAPRREYCPHRVHGNWRHFWDTGGGLMTDWGVHLLDIVHWAMDDEVPLEIEAVGEWVPGSVCDSPQKMTTEYRYPSYRLTWNQGAGQAFEPAGRGYGILFYGSEGDLYVDRELSLWYPKREGAPEPPLPRDAWRLPPVRSHWSDLYECIRDRRPPVSDVAVGHRSTATCILGNIALKCGRPLRWDGAAERFIDDPAADRLLDRPGRPPYAL